MAEELEMVGIDCHGLSSQAIAERLRTTPSDMSVRLEQMQPPVHGLAAGANLESKVAVDGSVGDFAFMLGANALLEISGNAGSSCGHSMVSGSVLVRGSVGDYLAAFAKGGLVVVHGTAGNRCGYGLAGGDAFVRGLVGKEAAFCMSDGVLVLGNGAGDGLGRGMTGGTLYIRGEAKSIDEQLRPFRMKDADAMRLSLLLARAGIKAASRDFKAYRPRAAVK